jgi:hypothetical protein
MGLKKDNGKETFNDESRRGSSTQQSRLRHPSVTAPASPPPKFLVPYRMGPFSTPKLGVFLRRLSRSMTELIEMLAWEDGAIYLLPLFHGPRLQDRFHCPLLEAMRVA